MIIGGISSVHQGSTIKLGSIKGGNSLLPEKLSQLLKNRIHLNARLASISKDATDSYKILFQNGETVIADIVVLAIPCSVYSDIHFEENIIPPKKLTNIQSIGYGSNAKILIPCENTPQERITLFNDRIGTFFNVNCHLITCYYTGKSSRFFADTIKDNLDQNRSMLEIGYSYFDSIPPVLARDEAFLSYSGPVGYSWPNDPYVKGSYSYIAPGQDFLLTDTSKVQGETVKTLFAPIGRTLYFAGEHTSILQDVPGTLEAACESGERTARMIFNEFIDA